MTVNCTEAVMKTCKYSQNISNKYFICDYAYRTGKLRKCSPKECDQYIKKNKKATKD